MLTIGIETSGRPGSVALVDDGQILDESLLDETASRHAQMLVPTIRKMLTSHGYEPGHIESVAVSVGPGSFTGVRVGVVAAKMFAYTTGCRLIGVDTFDAIAFGVNKFDVGESVGFQPARLAVIADAQRGGLFVSSFSNTGTTWESIGPCELIDVQSFKDSLTENDLVVGPGLVRYRNEIKMTDARIASKECWSPMAANVALCAYEMGQSSSVDPFQLQPCYVRKSAAEEKRTAP